MRTLRKSFEKRYAAFLIADSHESPTWPYTHGETASLSTWPGWSVIGPVFRTPAPADLDDVRTRHRIGGDDRIAVFTRGGGGQHPGRPDAAAFLSRAVEIGAAVKLADPEARLMFVRGPLWPADIDVPGLFDVIDQEPKMPALLKLARATIFRGGFNTLWESLSAGTACTPILGSWYQEAVHERMDALAIRGLLVENLQEHWLDERWHAERRARVRASLTMFTGAPEPGRFLTLLLDARARDQNRG
jgi:hypothetical protein